MLGVDSITLATWVTAAATAVLAVFTGVTLRYLARQEARAAQDRFDQHRPVLFPVGSLSFVDEMGVIDWQARDAHVPVQNAGSGVALNVAALLMGTPDLSMSERYTGWHPVPLPADPSPQAILLRVGASWIPPRATIDSCALSLPQGLTATGRVLRLTLTCEDIFRRKHVAIFDYLSVRRWERVAILEGTADDLHSLEDAAPK